MAHIVLNGALFADLIHHPCQEENLGTSSLHHLNPISPVPSLTLFVSQAIPVWTRRPALHRTATYYLQRAGVLVVAQGCKNGMGPVILRVGQICSLRFYLY